MRTENGVAVGVPKDLPKSWKNISGFNLLDDAGLKTHGWYPVNVVEPPAYDPDLQFRSLSYVVGENSITPTYTIQDFLDVGRIGQWCEVKEGAITGGPFKCPKVWDGVQMYLLTENELNAMFWFKYVDVEPEYNEDTQYLTHVNAITGTTVTANYTINNYSAGQMTERITRAQTAKLAEIRKAANDNLKDNTVSEDPWWRQRNAAQGICSEAEATAIANHISATRVESNRCEALINDEEATLASIRAVKATWPEEA